jgi:hypothetical protein
MSGSTLVERPHGRPLEQCVPYRAAHEPGVATGAAEPVEHAQQARVPRVGAQP